MEAVLARLERCFDEKQPPSKKATAGAAKKGGDRSCRACAIRLNATAGGCVVTSEHKDDEISDALFDLEKALSATVKVSTAVQRWSVTSCAVARSIEESPRVGEAAP